MRDIDGRGHVYSEFDMSADEAIRVTYVPKPTWVDEPTIRIQKRGPNGRLFQGEEFPASKAMELFRSVLEVIPAAGSLEAVLAEEVAG